MLIGSEDLRTVRLEAAHVVLTRKLPNAACQLQLEKCCEHFPGSELTLKPAQEFFELYSCVSLQVLQDQPLVIAHRSRPGFFSRAAAKE